MQKTEKNLFEARNKLKRLNADCLFFHKIYK